MPPHPSSRTPASPRLSPISCPHIPTPPTTAPTFLPLIPAPLPHSSNSPMSLPPTPPFPYIPALLPPLCPSPIFLSMSAHPEPHDSAPLCIHTHTHTCCLTYSLKLPHSWLVSCRPQPYLGQRTSQWVFPVLEAASMGSPGPAKPPGLSPRHQGLASSRAGPNGLLRALTSTGRGLLPEFSGRGCPGSRTSCGRAGLVHTQLSLCATVAPAPARAHSPSSLNVSLCHEQQDQ